MSLTLNPPPPTPAEPVAEILHGVPVTDPYRWLEDQNSQRTRKWLDEQYAYTRAYLDAIPARDRIRKRVEELLAVETISEPWKVGNRYFFMKRSAHQDQPIIMLLEGDSSEEQVPLVDPANRGEGSSTAVNILEISSDGKLLAYSVRRGGEESCAVEFLDVDRKQILSDRLPRGFYRGLVFSPANNGFYYVHHAMDATRPYYRAVRWHKFNTRPEEDREIFFAGEGPSVHLRTFGSHDGRFLAYLVVRQEDRLVFDCYIHDMTSGKAPKKIVEAIGGFFRPFLADKKIIALTDWNSPNGRIVAIDPDRTEHERCQEVVPESSRRIQDFVVVGGVIFVSYVDSRGTRIEAFDLTGRKRGTVPCPPHGTAHLLTRQPNLDTLFYRFTSFTTPPVIFKFDIHAATNDVWAHCQVPFDFSSIEIEQVLYPSKDGTLVPMFLVCQKRLHPLGPMPTFLTGYGGFGVSVTPQFAAYASFLIENGCLFAVANVRGGSELGGEWHLAARRHNRQTAISDFISAAEWLLETGRSEPGRMAIGGGSNAGTLVGAAMTQRPDLFSAVVCLCPLLDMLRYHLFDDANLCVDEYGTADNEEDFRYLRGYSPYHRVKDDVHYPAVMLISGDADMRCNPMHARKMAARLQVATNSGRPILLDYRPTRGHMPVQPMNERIGAVTDRLAFICYELGVSL